MEKRIKKRRREEEEEEECIALSNANQASSEDILEMVFKLVKKLK